MFPETKHLRIFFKNCPVLKQLCIIIFQVKFIQIFSGVTVRQFFARPIAKKQCQVNKKSANIQMLPKMSSFTISNQNFQSLQPYF